MSNLRPLYTDQHLWATSLEMFPSSNAAHISIHTSIQSFSTFVSTHVRAIMEDFMEIISFFGAGILVLYLHNNMKKNEMKPQNLGETMGFRKVTKKKS